jgi:hypothetical protein
MPKKMPDTGETVHVKAVGHHVRLGKLEPKKDKRMLKLARYAPARALPPLPSSVKTYTKVPSWPMYGNDKLGDCTCAAAGHMEQFWSAVQGKPETPADSLVVGTYWATGTADDGRYCLDVLNRWHRYGLGKSGSDEKIGAFVQLDLSKPNHYKYAISEFGGAYIGIALPISAQTQTYWKVTTGPNAEAGSWGGHCVPLLGYDRYGAWLATWGMVMKATWGFLNKYADEAYAIISPDWLGAGGKSPAGFDMTKLTADLGQLG